MYSHLEKVRNNILKVFSVLQIRDDYPGSGFFPIPDPTKQEEVKIFFTNLMNFLSTKFELFEYNLREYDLHGQFFYRNRTFFLSQSTPN
jgi:hypothetical protein